MGVLLMKQLLRLILMMGVAAVASGQSGLTLPANSIWANPTSSPTYARGVVAGTAGFVLGSNQILGSTVIVVSGTTYAPTCATIQGALVQFTSATAVTFTLPVATTSGCGAGFDFSMQVLGTGQVNVTPTTSVIKYNSTAGAATLALTQGTGVELTSDGTNYAASACTACTSGAVAPVPVNVLSATTYTVQASDNGKLLIFTNASVGSITLPVASTFPAGFFFYYTSGVGSGSSVVTPTTSTINGMASLVFNTGNTCMIISDGTNYQIGPCSAPGTSITLGKGLTVSGGIVNLNASSNSAVNIGTGTTNATVTIGGGSNAVTLNATTLTLQGAAYKPTLSGTSASLGGSALLAGACTTGTVSITGATTSMVVNVTPVTYPGAGVEWEGYVSAAGTVTVTVCGIIAVTPTASTYNVRVQQ
jgi:hypothetical protein